MSVVLFMAVRINPCLSSNVQSLKDLGLHPNNVLFHISGMESWTTDDVRKYLGKPQKLDINTQNLSQSPHLPKHLVRKPAVTNMLPLCLGRFSHHKLA